MPLEPVDIAPARFRPDMVEKIITIAFLLLSCSLRAADPAATSAPVFPPSIESYADQRT